MNATVSSINSSARADAPRLLAISLWVAGLAVAGIFGMAAFAKLFNYTPEGSMALAHALGVGRGVITLIGLTELAAAVAILIPRTRALGALLGTATAAGALLSHVTRIGFSGNAAAEMWPLALVVLAASAFVLLMSRGELPFVGANR